MRQISKEEAKAEGYKRYFTGVPCSRGHVAERSVSTTHCIECGRENSRRWHAANRDRAVTSIRARYAENAEARRAYARNRYAADLEGGRARGRARYAANPATSKSAERRRRASKKRAIPRWFGELDGFVWIEATDLVDLRRKATGLEWHADHMLPLMAKTVCGMHTWNNCQVIPAKLNMFKKNKLIFTEPFDWLKPGA